MKKEIEESCNKCDPIFVKDKIMCVIFICVYIYLCVQRKGSKRIFAKIVHSDNLWGMSLEVRGLIWLYVCWWGTVLLFLYCLNFFTSMYYFCNKNVFKK